MKKNLLHKSKQAALIVGLLIAGVIPSFIFENNSFAGDQHKSPNKESKTLNQLFAGFDANLKEMFPWVKFIKLSAYKKDTDDGSFSAWFKYGMSHAETELSFRVIPVEVNAEISQQEFLQMETPMVDESAMVLAETYARALMPVLMGERFFRVIFEVLMEEIREQPIELENGSTLEAAVATAVGVWNRTFQTRFEVEKVSFLENFSPKKISLEAVNFSIKDPEKEGFYAEFEGIVLNRKMDAQDLVKDVLAYMISTAALDLYAAEDLGVGSYREKNVQKPVSTRNALSCEHIFSDAYNSLGAMIDKD